MGKKETLVGTMCRHAKWRKDNAGKPDLTYLPYGSLADVARVCHYGAEKYSRDNWRDGRAESYVAAAMRHLHAWSDPEWSSRDVETGESHLAHAAASILFAIELERKSNEHDPEA